MATKPGDDAAPIERRDYKPPQDRPQPQRLNTQAQSIDTRGVAAVMRNTVSSVL